MPAILEKHAKTVCSEQAFKEESLTISELFSLCKPNISTSPQILQMSEYHFPSQRFKEKINLGFFSLNVAESGECQSILISPVKKLDTLLKYTLTGRGGDFDKFIH